MNSQRFLGVLQQNGFDKATAETIVSMADAKPVDEARELLASMIDVKSPHVESYLASRRHAEEAKKRLDSRITIKNAKPRQTKPQPVASKYSSTDKANSVRDLEAAMRRLSVGSPDRKMCDCMGTKYGLLEIAPNCLNCGRIICNKEGLGPCLFCGEPLLPNDQIKQIVDILTTQKNAVIATMSKKALIAAGIDPAIKQEMGDVLTSGEQAEANLERLLGYQDNDSVRTRIIDQVGEVDLPGQGLNQWATPQEQAEQLRLQQSRLRKLEHDRKVRSGQGRKVLSIDVRGNKIYQSIEDAPYEEEEDQEEEEEHIKQEADRREGNTSSKDELPKTVRYFDPKPYSHLKAPKFEATASIQPQRESEPIHVHRSADEDLLY